MPKRELKDNMVLCLECYAGKIGAPFGVKLEEQVLVTPNGPRSICAYPYESKLLD
jgi:Xaa-Pro aminopeptidase